MLPTSRVRTARAQIAGRQSVRYGANAMRRTRSSAANPAALVADAMNAVIGVGAPS